MMQAIKGITIGVGVKNAQEAMIWYKDLLGDIEIMEPVPNLFEIRLSENTWLQLDDTGYLDIGGGSSIIRFETENIESAHKLVLKITSDVEEVIEIEGVVKYFDFKDQSGNRLSFVQVL